MGILRKAGWGLGDDGKEVFVVVVEYSKDDVPPDFPIMAIWKQMPVKVVLDEEQQ